MFMGQILTPLGGPADAGRAVVASDRVYGLGPAGFHPSLAALGFRLCAWRRCALRLPAQGGSFHEPPPHGSPRPSHTLHRPTAGLGWRAGRLTRPCGASPSRVACGSHGKAGISLATPAASRGKGATRLQMGGGLQCAGRPATRPARSVASLPASSHARRQPIRHKAAPSGRYLFRSADGPACHAPLHRRTSPRRLSACRHPSRKPPAPPAAVRRERQNRVEAGRLEDAGSFAGRLGN